MPHAPSGDAMTTPGTDELLLGSLEEGWALCLSGGGYRAMLFHLGVLWRLNERLLPKLDRVSSVSGGSITAGALGIAWERLDFDGDGVARGFGREVVEPHPRARRPARSTKVDHRGVLFPARRRRASRRRTASTCSATRRSRTCPDDEPALRHQRDQRPDRRPVALPEAVHGATTASAVDTRASPLANAVAASSAFPPFLSPVAIELERGFGRTRQA